MVIYTFIHFQIYVIYLSYFVEIKFFTFFHIKIPPITSL